MQIYGTSALVSCCNPEAHLHTQSMVELLKGVFPAPKLNPADSDWSSPCRRGGGGGGWRMRHVAVEKYTVVAYF